MSSSNQKRFTFDPIESERAKICVVGVGGGGGNALNNMIAQGIEGVDFIAVNTDAQALSANRAQHKFQAGRDFTKGLGAGARPQVGQKAVEESIDDIAKMLDGYDMAFVTAGMGGGTGTGGAPVVAKAARDLGILTVGVVTKPFDCEGKRRMEYAENGIQQLQEHVDTLIVIPNERLLDISDASTSLIEAFRLVDEVLYNATRGISDLITIHGIINLDFADVKTTMQDGGRALMGSAVATGANRAQDAAMAAISSPLLDGFSIVGAKNLLVNVTAGRSLGLREATQATDIIKQESQGDCEVIFGTVIDDSMDEELRVTVIATGFDRREKPKAPVHVLDGRYKGEDNLRDLDAPAYMRRSKTEAENSKGGTTPTPDADNQGVRVRRLDVNQLNRQPDRASQDGSDTPAFLRKMLD